MSEQNCTYEELLAQPRIYIQPKSSYIPDKTYRSSIKSKCWKAVQEYVVYENVTSVQIFAEILVQLQASLVDNKTVRWDQAGGLLFIPVRTGGEFIPEDQFPVYILGKDLVVWEWPEVSFFVRIPEKPGRYYFYRAMRRSTLLDVGEEEFEAEKQRCAKWLEEEM